MRRHWHKRPLLVRAAWPDARPPVTRAELFRLASRDDVESRLVQRSGTGPRAAWSLQRGPLRRRALPPVTQAGWTLLVQGLDLHVPAAATLLQRFRFVPQARLDDLMISWASAGGGVGPHFDSYDVFLIQVQGQRRWRIGPLTDGEVPRLRAGVPLKVLANFKPEQEWVLDPGDLLYLPPGWAHDGDAVGGDCMTCSVGFRAATRAELAREALLRLADAVADAAQSFHASVGPAPDLYRDPQQRATATPGRIPIALQRHARQGLLQALREPGALDRALGEYLSEPKAQVQFEPPDELHDPTAWQAGVTLDARSCMLYDDTHIYLNGESWRASGRDAELLRQLADARCLDAPALRRASRALRAQLADWIDDGWLQPLSPARVTRLGL
jgi:50S ribosomal protein L16 3-hydroxylase